MKESTDISHSCNFGVTDVLTEQARWERQPTPLGNDGDQEFQGQSPAQHAGFVRKSRPVAAVFCKGVSTARIMVAMVFGTGMQKGFLFATFCACQEVRDIQSLLSQRPDSMDLKRFFRF